MIRESVLQTYETNSLKGMRKGADVSNFGNEEPKTKCKELHIINVLQMTELFPQGYRLTTLILLHIYTGNKRLSKWMAGRENHWIRNSQISKEGG